MMLIAQRRITLCLIPIHYRLPPLQRVPRKDNRPNLSYAECSRARYLRRGTPTEKKLDLSGVFLRTAVFSRLSSEIWSAFNWDDSDYRGGGKVRNKNQALTGNTHHQLRRSMLGDPLRKARLVLVRVSAVTQTLYPDNYLSFKPTETGEG